MPAAAVIPAPIAYIKVAAVKMLLVGFGAGSTGPPSAAGVRNWAPAAGRRNTGRLARLLPRRPVVPLSERGRDRRR